jgi:hypothetical protein
MQCCDKSRKQVLAQHEDVRRQWLRPLHEPELGNSVETGPVACAAANSCRPSFGQRINDADPRRSEIAMETARTVFDAVAHHLTVALT